MPDLFQVKLVDSLGERLREFHAEVWLDGAASAVTIDESGFRLPLPQAATIVRVRVETREAWDVDETFRIDRAAAQPIALAQPQRLSMATLEFGTRERSDGRTYFVSFWLGQLMDVLDDPIACRALRVDPSRLPQHDGHRALVIPYRGAQRPAPGQRTFLPYDFRQRAADPRRVLEEPMLGDLGRPGRTRLRYHEISPHREGRMFLLQRKPRSPRDLPRLVLVYTGHVDVRDPRLRGVGYHVFLHPSVQDHFSDSPRDPYDDPYIERAYRLGLGLADSHWVARKMAVMVLPLGMKHVQFGPWLTRGGMHRLLREIHAWLHRRELVPWTTVARRPIDRVAMSTHSYGINFLVDVLSNAGQPEPSGNQRFYDLVKEIYLYDGALTRAGWDFARTYAVYTDWYRGGRDGRHLRIYASQLPSREHDWSAVERGLGGRIRLQTFSNPAKPHRRGQCGVLTGASSHAGTLALFAPYFWDGFDPDPVPPFPWRDEHNHARGRQTEEEVYFWRGHGACRAWFNLEALRRSGFPDAAAP